MLTNGGDDVHALEYFTEYDVLTIQPAGHDGGNELDETESVRALARSKVCLTN